MTSQNARDKLLALFGVFIGVLMIVFALPRFLAYSSLVDIPREVERALKEGRALPAPILALSVKKYRHAADLVPDVAIIQQDLGRLEMRRAYEPDVLLAERHNILLLASKRFRAAIAAAPSRAFPWSLEAIVQSELHAEPELINEIMRMSYALGPHEASSILLRARVAGGLWQDLAADVQSNVGKDYVEMWRYSEMRPSLIIIYLESDFPARLTLRKTVLQRKKDMLLFDKMVMDRVRSNSKR